jgi:hypothetical protein
MALLDKATAFANRLLAFEDLVRLALRWHSNLSNVETGQATRSSLSMFALCKAYAKLKPQSRAAKTDIDVRAQEGCFLARS